MVVKECSMTTTEIERRLTALEDEMAFLKSGARSQNRWWDKIAGAFANDPLFEEAMRAGRQWREAETPGSKKRLPSKRKAGK
jgi:hypothetical protein